MNDVRNKQVMLIDDNQVDHFIVASICRRLPIDKPLLSFTMVEKAIMFLQSQPLHLLPDLIFVDINMPGMNGFDFLRAFSSLPQPVKQHCRIVMLSSSLTQPEIDELESNSDVMMFMEKPLAPSRLKQLLAML